jgi:DnaK suppressor protein
MMTVERPRHISPADLERLRAMLVHQRDTLLAAQRDGGEAQRGISDGSGEQADVAERMIAQESAIRISSFDRALLDEIERALAKLEAGTYGVSEQSGQAIPLERLEAIPWARLTADEEERLDSDPHERAYVYGRTE